MSQPNPLHLYEEIMLLSLRDEKGTVEIACSELAIAGAVLAELLMEGLISVEDTRKRLVDVRDIRPAGDPIVDECLDRMASGKRRASLQTWVSRLAGIKDLRHKAAGRLCERGILSAEKDKVLLVFTRRIYPELDPGPEREIVERVRRALFTDDPQVDPRTVVLISLAHRVGLLAGPFGRKEIRVREKRIEQLINGELTGQATKEVIAAAQVAVMVASMAAVIAASS